jgi:hypothetical protein
MELEALTKEQLAAIAVVLIKRIAKLEHATGGAGVSKSDKAWLEDLLREADKVKLR